MDDQTKLRTADGLEDQENVNLVNKMRNYKDPLLEEFDQEVEKAEKAEEGTSSEEEGTSEESDEEEDEINFPRDNVQDLLQFIHRDLTNVQNMEDGQKRKFSLIRLYQIFVLAKNKAPNKVYQEMLPEIQKILFKRLNDKVEKNRELAALLIKEFFARCDDLTLSIPYLLPIIVERLNADDLEGVDYLDEKMKPVANQKAQVMIDPPEKSEAVRKLIAEIITIIVSTTLFDCLRPYVDAFSNICKALCMDPYGEVIIQGTRAISEFAKAGGDQLIHFCESMGRSLFTAFVHKHAKVRMAGLRALFDVLYTGQWKTSVFVFEAMIGFRDPNVVPIKEFYDPSTKVNYFAMFIQDRSVVCRQCFYKTMGKLLTDLPDKVDHEGRIFPYLLSGLYDPNDDIRKLCFEVIEEVGLRHEEENEDKFREIKQFGYKPEWMFGGIIKDEHIPLPDPLTHRPRLGARILVRSYVRRYLKALYKEIGDWIEDNQERSSKLLMFSICYVEEFMTQYLDHLLVAMYKSILNKQNKVVAKNVPFSFRLLGRYTSPKSYGPLVIQAIRNELASFYQHTAPGSLRAFGYIFAGSIELLQPEQDIVHLADLLKDFMKAIEETVLDSIDLETADHLLETLSTMVEWLLKKKEESVDVRLIEEYLPQLLRFLLHCNSAYCTYKLQKKVEPEQIKQQKQKVLETIAGLQKLRTGDFEEGADYFDEQLLLIIEDNYIELGPLFEADLIVQKEREEREAKEKALRQTEEYKKQEKEASKARQEELIAEIEKLKKENCEKKEAQAIEDAKKADGEESQATESTEATKAPEGTPEGITGEKAEEGEEQAEPKIEEAPPSQALVKTSNNDDDLPDEIPESLMKFMPNAPKEPLTEQQLKDMDRVASVKNWVMQSYDWRLLNVLMEMMTVEQLTYICKNGKPIVSNVITVLKLALCKQPKTEQEQRPSLFKTPTKDKPDVPGMTPVKRYIISTVIPSFVNKCLPKMTPSLSLEFLELLTFAQKVEGHLKDYDTTKLKHNNEMQKMHLNLLECGGVQFHSRELVQYEDIFAMVVATVSNCKDEQNKQQGLKLMKNYCVEFHKQIVAPINSAAEQERLLADTLFLASFTDTLLPLLNDYYETVRFEAQQLLLCIASRFLPKQSALNQQQVDLVQMLKANMKHEWPSQLTSQLKDAAKMESDLLRFMFSNSIDFLARVVTVYMDETYGRENIIKFMKMLHTSMPFQLLNDFRMAKATNSLRKVEVLGELLQQI